MRIGITGTAEIAFRRFLPALKNCPSLSYAGVASRTPQKGMRFQEMFGGTIYESYDALLADDSIDAVYVPLPPALHFEWGKKVLESGKHLFMEKPFTTCVKDTEILLNLAEQKNLVTYENYMFLYHSQLAWIKKQIETEKIGELRLIRAAFGFPFRGNRDFRYDKILGGGALLDCGGYPVRLATELLGATTQVTAASLNTGRGLDVDIFGSATLENELGNTAQISFGMDNSYKCELELWGSTGYLQAGRIFTAPADYAPTVVLAAQMGEERCVLNADDSFLNSIQQFIRLVCEKELRAEERKKILRQSKLVDTIQKEGV